MKLSVSLLAFVSGLGLASIAHAQQASLPITSPEHVRITYLHVGGSCTIFMVDKLPGLKFGIDTGPKLTVGGGVSNHNFVGRATQANSVIAHYIANLPLNHFTYDDDPNKQLICNDADMAYLADDIDG